MTSPAPLASDSSTVAAPARRSADDLRARLIWLTLARLAIASVILIVALIAGGGIAGSAPASRVTFGVVLALYGVSFAYTLSLQRGRWLRQLAIAQLGLDLVAWAVLVFVTGGAGSPLSFFFALSTLTAALVLGAAAARSAAVVAIAVYGIIALAPSIDWLPGALRQFYPAPMTAGELAYQLVVNFVGIVVVAALGGSLASRASRVGGALASSEASRAALESLYEDVLRSIPVALLTCAPDGRIDSANPVAALLFGVQAHALLGSPVSQWLPFLSADAFRAGAPPRAGDDVLAQNDHRVAIAYLAAPLYDRQGDARGGIVVVEDRSDVEHMRDAVQRSERLAVLGRLAAGLAHEIRNPLGAISGCVELVREGNSLNDEDRALLATVLREVTRVNDLVTDMLAFSRPRPPERVDTDLVAIARDVVTLANTPGARGPVVLSAPEDAVVRASVDPAQIRQVLWNLIRNAWQASPAGAVVDVSVSALPAGGATLAVSDRGAGIPAGMREKLFDVFYTEGTRGTGLGLAIVKQIADGHGGIVQVRARDGGGTEFVLEIP